MADKRYCVGGSMDGRFTFYDGPALKVRVAQKADSINNHIETYVEQEMAFGGDTALLYVHESIEELDCSVSMFKKASSASGALRLSW